MTGDLALFAAFALLILATINGAMLYRGKQVVSAAAQDGARAGAAEWGNAAAAKRRAENTLEFSSLVSNERIEVDEADQRLKVSVIADVRAPFLGWTITFASYADAPRERIVSSTERPG